MSDASAALPSAGADVTPGAAASTSDVAREWLVGLSQVLPGMRQGAVVLGEPDLGPFVPRALWPEGALPDAGLTDAAEQAIATRETVVVGEGGARGVSLSCPVMVGRHLHGVVAVHGHFEGGALMAALRQLNWGLGALQAHLTAMRAGDESQTRERLLAALDALAVTLAESSHEEAANALATELARRLDCDRVSIGLRRRRRRGCRVLALSHSAQIAERMDVVQAIGRAMDEAIDQKATIAWPATRDTVLVLREHEDLGRRHGAGSVLTVPFAVGGDRQAGGWVAEGAFCFERPADRPFDAATIELCEAVARLSAPALEARRLNDRPWLVRLRDDAGIQARRLFGEGYLGRKLLVLATAAATAFVALVPGEFTVPARATLEGATRRLLLAPYDGYLETAPRRAGDEVRAGTVLATLDQRELRLEYLKWAAQVEQYARQYQGAIAQRGRGEGAIALAQAQQARAQMELLADQIKRASIVAPFDGILVAGDLSQSLGSAVKRGQTLFELSPLNAYRIVLEVDETDIAHLQEQQRGELVLTAMPQQPLPFRVTRLTPVTAAREGRSFFRVEATLEAAATGLRPGLEGVGKVTVGERSLLWIWSRRLVDWLRLTAWVGW